MKGNAYRGERVHVCSTKCRTCIYRPGNLMRLQPGRVQVMEQEAIASGGAIICHKTLDGDNAVCRGFFDVAKHEVQALQVAERLGVIAWDDPDG